MILEVESINDHYRRYAREIVKDYTNDLVVHHTPVL
ncbi:hypothetical protein CFSAN001628_021090 [Clostridium botulinum CFSAN001628]|nr:hypothetical protein CFSAN001628_021090 [Clostridium botulinum CFSAN001628]